MYAGIARPEGGRIRLLAIAGMALAFLTMHHAIAFFNVAEAPSRPIKRSPSPSVVAKEKKSAKLEQQKNDLLRELKKVELELAMTLQEENRVDEEPEENDPELARLRRKYNIKAKVETPPGPDSVSRREFNEMQPIREARGAIAQAALLRAATEEDDWNCDEACLAALAGERRLPPKEVETLDRKLQDDVRKVQKKLGELEFSQRFQFSVENRRRISSLKQFLALIPTLRRKAVRL